MTDSKQTDCGLQTDTDTDRQTDRQTHMTTTQRYGKRFEPRDISYLFGVIVRVRVVFRKQ